jgi:hypothetical protein
MNEKEENGAFYRDTIEDMGNENYSLEDPMTFWNAEKRTLWKRILNRTETPFVLMGIGLVVVVAVFFAFFPREKGGDVFPDSEAISQRLGQVEEKIGSVETALKPLSGLQEDMETVKKSVLRFDSADASMSARVQRLAEELASLKDEMAELKKAREAEVKTSAAAPRADQTEAASGAVYHEVRKGDTLYNISRRYDVSVGEIRSLNGLSGQDAIHPGQKLKVEE